MQTDITIKASVAGSGGQKPPVPVARTTEAAATTQTSKPAAPAERPSPEQLEAAVSELSNAMQSVQRNLNFSIDEDSGQTVVKVIDSSSNEVIRQFPSEEALALARRMRESDSSEISGLLLQSKA